MASQQTRIPDVSYARLKRDKPAVYAELMIDIAHLDRRARAPQEMILGAATIPEYTSTHCHNDGTDHTKQHAWKGHWHEADASRIRFLAHRYDRGEWGGEQDRAAPRDASEKPVALRYALAYQHLLSMASFVRHHGGPEYLIQAIIDQANRSTDGRAITALEVTGIAPEYVEAERRAAHDAGEPYFYLDAEGSIAVAAVKRKRVAK